jgi:hypothetical protein
VVNGHAAIPGLLPGFATEEEAIKAILKPLSEADFDWNLPLNKWSKEAIIRFLSTAQDLTYDA